MVLLFTLAVVDKFGEGDGRHFHLLHPLQPPVVPFEVMVNVFTIHRAHHRWNKHKMMKQLILDIHIPVRNQLLIHKVLRVEHAQVLEDLLLHKEHRGIVEP